MDYIAYMCKGQDAHYAVKFPDCPGCTTEGRTLDEAWNRAVDALTLHLAKVVEQGGALPRASTLEDLAGDPEMQGAVAVLVTAEAPEKTVRVNITARASQLETIDRLARIAGMTRSAFLVQTAIRQGGLVGRSRAAMD